MTNGVSKTSLTIGTAATLQGGAGGAGGTSSLEKVGSGGHGGDGLALTGSAATTITNAGTLSGGNGGTGGGNGGDGGNGLDVLGTGAVTLTNSGTIAGGSGGSGQGNVHPGATAPASGARTSPSPTQARSPAAARGRRRPTPSPSPGAPTASRPAVRRRHADLVGCQHLSGGTTVSGGRLRLSNASTTAAIASLGSGAVSIADDTTLEVFNAANAAANFVLGNTILGGGGVVYSGSAASVTNVTGANTFTGRMILQSGTLVAKSSGALGASSGFALVNSGATLKIEGDGLQFARTLSIAGTGVGNRGALRNAGTDPDGINAVQNILLASASRINSDSGSLNIEGQIEGENLNLTFGGAGNINVLGAIETGTGTLTKDGTGVLALYGVNSYTGRTTVSNGFLDVLGGNAISDSGAVVVAPRASSGSSRARPSDRSQAAVESTSLAPTWRPVATTARPSSPASSETSTPPPSAGWRRPAPARSPSPVPTITAAPRASPAAR